MTVYVDSAFIGLGRMKMCHLIADTPEELHAMADKIGLQRRWYQSPPSASFWHYDVSKGKRCLAIELGAVEVDRRILVDAMQRIRMSGVFRK